MKIFKKRIIAYAIDSSVIAFLVAGINETLLSFNVKAYNWEICAILALLALKDVIFINRSLGKKIMRISIYKEWKRPDIKTLIIRSVFTQTVGFILYWKSKFLKDQTLTAIDWENNKLKTYVIDDKVFKSLHERASTLDGDYTQNMTELYKSYLIGIYQK